MEPSISNHFISLKRRAKSKCFALPAFNPSYAPSNCSLERPQTLAHRTAGLQRLLRKLASRSHLIAIALILTLGIGFRFYGLDHKVYWHDEVFTSLRAAGYTGEEVARQLLNQTVTAGDLQQFQQLSPDKTWADTWASLKTHPEHPPLFYLLERAWMGSMGSSVAATRGLSALFSITLFPLIAWFCNGLSQSRSQGSTSTGRQSSRSFKALGRQTAAVAIALLAVSPVQLLYAQEAREYSLWACEIILASGLLWRVVQTPQNWKLWLGYGGAIALSLYTTLLTGLVIIAHGLFVLGNSFFNGEPSSYQRGNPLSLQEGTSQESLFEQQLDFLPPGSASELPSGKGEWRQLLPWLSTTIAAVLIFSPWLLVTFQASQKLSSVTAWTTVPFPWEVLSKLWGLHLAASFIDLGLPLEHPYSLIAPAAALLIVGLSWLAIPQRLMRWFLLTLLVVPALLLMLPDLIQGGQRSSVTRYFMPLVLTALVTVALGIARGLRSAKSTSRLACQLLLVGLLTAGTVSGYKSAIAPAWWNKSFNFVMPAMADYIAQAQQTQPTPIWIELGSNGLGNAIALSHRLSPETPFYFFKLPNLPAAPEAPVLIPYASGDLIEAAQQTYGETMEVVEAPEVYELWRLK